MCVWSKQRKNPILPKQDTSLHSYFPPKEMIKIENQTANKNPLCEQQWSCCLMSGGKVSKHPCPLGSTGIPHGERSMQNYVPCSDFTRSSWKCEVCSPTASVYSPARWVNAFVTHFENLGYKDAFKKIAGFGRILERQAGIILKRSWPEPVPYPFQLTLRESPLIAQDRVPAIHPILRDQTRISEALPLYLLSGWTL